MVDLMNIGEEGKNLLKVHANLYTKLIEIPKKREMRRY